MRLARTAALLLAITIHAAPAIAADQIVFLVRHAEQAATGDAGASTRMMAGDPPLAPAGRQRADRLSALLAASGIQRIYTTEFLRTRQTAAPLAAILKIEPVMVASKDPDSLIAQIRTAPGNVLVVAHATTIPDVLKRLGVNEAAQVPDSDYGNLFIVVRPSAGEATLIRLRY
jgi:broad specificity phosphatase PhoE